MALSETAADAILRELALLQRALALHTPASLCKAKEIALDRVNPNSSNGLLCLLSLAKCSISCS